MAQVVTANRLHDGVVVFVGPGGAWVDHLGEAAVFDTAEATAAALAASRHAEEANLVLDVYAIDVVQRDGAVTPVRLREAIRAVGPTVHPDHCKAFPAA